MLPQAPTPQDTTIDGIRFRVTPLGSKRARRLFVRLAKALGPALGLLLDSAPSLAALEAEARAQGGWGAFLGKIAGDLDPDDLDATFADLEDVAQYSIDGGVKWPFLTPSAQEILFPGGKVLLSLKFLAFALRVQFADFVDALATPPAESVRSGGTPASSPG